MFAVVFFLKRQKKLIAAEGRKNGLKDPDGESEEGEIVQSTKQMVASMLCSLASCLRQKVCIMPFLKSSNYYVGQLVGILKKFIDDSDIVLEVLRVLRQVLMPSLGEARETEKDKAW